MVRFPKKVLFFFLPLLCGLATGGVAPTAAGAASPSEDSLWVYLMSFQSHDTFYFDLRRDGAIFVVKEDRYALGFSEMRSGKLSREMTERVFSVVTSRDVLDARDTEQGEQMFSESEWVSIGLMRGGRVTNLWGFREELKDYPEGFRRVVAELKSSSKLLPIASDIKAVIYASPVDAQRAKSIKDDERRFYDFVSVGEKQLSSLPSLRHAIQVANRRIPVRGQSELEALERLLKQSNLKSISTDFFIEYDGEVHQIELRMRAVAAPNNGMQRSANTRDFIFERGGCAPADAGR
jgi:hypothetical protein